MNRIAQIPLGALKNSGGLSASTGKKPIQDLREWLSCVDRMGVGPGPSARRPRRGDEHRLFLICRIKFDRRGLSRLLQRECNAPQAEAKNVPQHPGADAAFL